MWPGPQTRQKTALEKEAEEKRASEDTQPRLSSGPGESSATSRVDPSKFSRPPLRRMGAIERARSQTGIILDPYSSRARSNNPWFEIPDIHLLSRSIAAATSGPPSSGTRLRQGGVRAALARIAAPSISREDQGIPSAPTELERLARLADATLPVSIHQARTISDITRFVDRPRSEEKPVVPGVAPTGDAILHPSGEGTPTPLWTLTQNLISQVSVEAQPSSSELSDDGLPRLSRIEASRGGTRGADRGGDRGSDRSATRGTRASSIPVRRDSTYGGPRRYGPRGRIRPSSPAIIRPVVDRAQEPTYPIPRRVGIPRLQGVRSEGLLPLRGVGRSRAPGAQTGGPLPVRGVASPRAQGVQAGSYYPIRGVDHPRTRGTQRGGPQPIRGVGRSGVQATQRESPRLLRSILHRTEAGDDASRPPIRGRARRLAEAAVAVGKANPTVPTGASLPRLAGTKPGAPIKSARAGHRSWPGAEPPPLRRSARLSEGAAGRAAAPTQVQGSSNGAGRGVRGRTRGARGAAGDSG